MAETIVIMFVVAGLLFVAWQRASARARILAQFDRGTVAVSAGGEASPPARAWRPPQLVSPAVGLAVGLGAVLLGTPPALGLAAGVATIVVVALLAGTLAERRRQRLERQLAEAIDITVSSLRAGVGISDALGDAAEIAKPPIRPQLVHFLARIQHGEDPVFACKDTARSVRLESFRLFYFALAVHWEGGGSLARTLATTGRFIRDRAEVGRRIRSQSAEARFSVLGIFALTYVLAALMWRANPEPMEGFLGTGLGQGLVALGAVLQALGAGWISRLVRIRY